MTRSAPACTSGPPELIRPEPPAGVARVTPPRQVEILALIWHNKQVLDLRGPSLRVRILSFEPSSMARPTGAERRFTPFLKQE